MSRKQRMYHMRSHDGFEIGQVVFVRYKGNLRKNPRLYRAKILYLVKSSRRISVMVKILEGRYKDTIERYFTSALKKYQES